MTIVNLKPANELMPQVERVLASVFAHLAALLPDAELHHIGATAISGAVTKGDLDVLVRVSSVRFPLAVQVLGKHFVVKQPANWTAEFASFGDDTGHALPLGIQVVVKDSEDDFLLFLRDYFLSHNDALLEYNRLKLTHFSEGPDSYWKAKNEFLGKILQERKYNTA